MSLPRLEASRIRELRKERGWGVVFNPDLEQLEPEEIRSLRAVLVYELSGNPKAYASRVRMAAQKSSPLPLIVGVSDEDLLEAVGLKGHRDPFLCFLGAASLFQGENLYAILIHGHAIEMALVKAPPACPLGVVREALLEGSEAAAERSARLGDVSKLNLQLVKGAGSAIRSFADRYADLAASANWEKEETRRDLVEKGYTATPHGPWVPVLAPVKWDPILDTKGYPVGLGDTFTGVAGARIGEQIVRALGLVKGQEGRG